MGTLDDTINTVIPIIVLFVGLYLLYRPLSEPINKLLSMVKSGVLGIKGRVSKDGEEEPGELGEIQYE